LIGEKKRKSRLHPLHWTPRWGGKARNRRKKESISKEWAREKEEKGKGYARSVRKGRGEELARLFPCLPTEEDKRTVITKKEKEGRFG